VTNILKTSLTLTLDVEVKYQTLGAEPQHGLPEQIDLTAVSFTLPGKSRKRKVDILQILTEQEVLSLEDEIEERRKQWFLRRYPVTGTPSH
jgi:hypothetical protein